MNEIALSKVEEYCKILRFGSNIAKNMSKIEADTNEEFVAKIFELEIKHRESVRKERYLKQANFDIVKTFDNYNFDHIEMPVSINISEIKSASFVKKKENLILYGPVGTGKTHCATATGVAAIANGMKVKFYRTSALVTDLIDAKSNGTLKKLLKQIDSLNLLICDEWGYIPLDIEGSKLLYQVITSCYERKSLIITTNLEFSKWNGIFYDEKLTSAIIDRMVHHSHLIVFNGPSYRLENSLMKTS